MSASAPQALGEAPQLGRGDRPRGQVDEGHGGAPLLEEAQRPLRRAGVPAPEDLDGDFPRDRGAHQPAAARVRMRRGFSTVMVRIVASSTPDARRRGRNVSER